MIRLYFFTGGPQEAEYCGYEILANHVNLIDTFMDHVPNLAYHIVYKVLLECSFIHWFIHYWCVFFVLQILCWIVAKESIIKIKIFTIWPFTENLCWHLLYGIQMLSQSGVPATSLSFYTRKASFCLVNEHLTHPWNSLQSLTGKNKFQIQLRI